MSIPLRSRVSSAFALITALSVSLLALAGCGSQPSGQTQAQNAVSTSNAPPERAINFKIGIMTGTVSQGEEEFRAGQPVIEQVRRRRVKHVTYPDNFMNEQETVIAQLVGLAADPDVKVIIVGQAIPGSIAAARKIREQRPDILMGFVEPHEDPVDRQSSGGPRHPARPARARPRPSSRRPRRWARRTSSTTRSRVTCRSSSSRSGATS